jgi:hypothetical protein
MGYVYYSEIIIYNIHYMFRLYLAIFRSYMFHLD